MSEDHEANDERPCLHCSIIEMVNEFFAEYPVSAGGPDIVDTAEVITAIAKVVAELTSSQDTAIRQSVIEQLMREIMDYDSEFRSQDAMGTDRSHARH